LPPFLLPRLHPALRQERCVALLVSARHMEQVCAVPSYLRGGHKEANMPVLLLVGIPVVLVGGGFVIYRIIGG
jgi:hypothetical protein